MLKTSYLLCHSLVGSVAELGGSIDPFEVDFLERFPTRVDEHGFAEGHDSLLDAWYGAFEEYEVVLDFSVANEAAHAGSHQLLSKKIEKEGY